MDFLYPSTERRGRCVQLTSYDKGPLRWMPGILADWSRRCVVLRPRQTHEAAAVEGAGLLTRLFVAFPNRIRPSLLREVVMRIYWDGDEHPAIETPVGDFFGIHHQTWRQYDSRFLSVVSGGMVCTAPMPFAKGFRITFTQDGNIPLPLFFYGMGYYELDEADVSPLRFRAQWRREALAEKHRPYTFLETDGSGLYLGLHLSTRNRDAWLLRAPWTWMLPRGLGLGQLEGWEELYIDGENESRHSGTGHEEYFNTGWYFSDGAFTGIDHGVLERSYRTGRTASYRYHWRDPLAFRESFRGIIHHGMNDVIPAEYASTAYWYQKGPAGGGYSIPPVEGRVPRVRDRGRKVFY
ncbi:MAG: DUF2961 domain-containing protein [Chrysiogenetes bacterium]|nr:DUF2961 domain-containing protein [Chrysiogenetes bacterium]